MSDLIRREDVIKAVWKPQVKPNELIFDALKRAIESEINNLPSADKSGEWIDQDMGAYYPIECSECHKQPLLDEYGSYVLSDFCPNCGADMRGADDE